MGNNESPQQQSMSFEFDRTVTTTKTSSFSSTQGIKVGTTFKTGIPFLASGKITTEVSVEFTEGGSHSTMDSQALKASFPIQVPGNSCYTSYAQVTSSTIDVDVTYSVQRNWEVFVMLGQACAMTGDTQVKAHYS